MYETTERTISTRLPKFDPLATTAETMLDEIGKRTGLPEYRTDITPIDKLMLGLHPSRLLTLAARPAVGKTSVACQLAYNVARRGKKVAFLSLEMTAENILERMMCSYYGIKGWKLLNNKIDADIKKKFGYFMKDVQTLPLQIIDDYCFTEKELFTLIDHLKFRPDVIILDHLQHIRCESKRSQYESLTSYLGYLKEVAMRYKTSVVVLSQINRSGEEAPTLANLKGTGAIEEMSDYVVFLHDNKTTGENKPNNKEFDFIIAKNRFGACGKQVMNFNAECYQLNDIEIPAITY